MPPPLPPAAGCCRRGRSQPPHVRPTGRALPPRASRPNLKPQASPRMILRATHGPDHRSATRRRGGGGAVLRPHRESAHPWPATPPRSAGAPGPAGSLAYTRVHPEAVVKLVDRAAGDRHHATSASVAVGSLHTNKTAHGAGHHGRRSVCTPPRPGRGRPTPGCPRRSRPAATRGPTSGSPAGVRRSRPSAAAARAAPRPATAPAPAPLVPEPSARHHRHTS